MFNIEDVPRAALAALNADHVLVSLGWIVAVVLFGVLGLVLHRLRKAERVLFLRDAFFNQAPVGVCIVDGDTGRMLRGNLKALEYFGLEKDTTDFDFYGAMGAEKAESFRLALQKDRAFPAEELSMTTRSGRELWVSLTASELRINEHRYVHVLFLDVTERKHFHDEMVLLNKRLHALVKAAPDPIIVADVQGTILYESDTCIAMRGGTPGQMAAGSQIGDLLPEPLKEVARDHFKSIMAGNTDVLPPFRVSEGNGDVLWIEGHGSVISDPAENEKVVMLILRDVTQRMEAERKLREHAAALEETHRRLTKLQNDVLSICAWTKQVHVDGKWIPVDLYLRDHLGLKITHDISDEGVARLTKGEL